MGILFISHSSQNNDRAIREGHDIGHAHASVVVAAAVAVVPLTAGVALAVVALR